MRRLATVLAAPAGTEDSMNALQVLLISFASLGAGETVLLDFSGEACAPCRQMLPVMQRLAAEGHPIRVIDTSREPDLVRRHGVLALPTLVMLVDGQEVDRSVGATSRERLLEMLAKAPAAAGNSAAPQLTDWQAPAPAERPALPLRTASAPLNLYAYPTAPRSPGGPLEQRLLAATARLRVDDSRGAAGQTAYSSGTGTIIDAGDGEALVLTCAHIFRDSQGKGAIAVDLFSTGGPAASPAS